MAANTTPGYCRADVTAGAQPPRKQVKFDNDTGVGAGAGAAPAASNPTHEDAQRQSPKATHDAGVPLAPLNDTTASILQNRLLLWVQSKVLAHRCVQN